MTRQKWTTKEQEAWLEQHRTAFLEANQARTAAKDFFPNVAKAFREKWPLPPVTQAEIQDAGSVEFAERVKRDNADKCLRAWFHNNCRNMAKKVSSRDVLNVRRPSQPRKLQPWQAYQALTYESMWKADVDREWNDYKAAWYAEHPDEKLPKTRLEIMSAFMRKKYEETDDEMKAKCEKYRVPETRAEVIPAPVKEQDVINLQYQEAIEKLPRSLLNIAESLWNQTGWNVTIMVGGPMPANNGAIVTYITNVRRSKEGKSYKEFLGSKNWDEHMHRLFDHFLRESFGPEVCAARALPDAQPQSSQDQNEERVDDEEPSTSTNHAATMAQGQPSQYELDRSRNIENLKGILSKLKEDYPVPEDLEGKRGKERAPPRKKKETRIEEGQKEQTRQSARLKVVEGTISPSQPTVASHSVNAASSENLISDAAKNADTNACVVDSHSQVPDSIEGPCQLTESSKGSLLPFGPMVPAASKDGPISRENSISDAEKSTDTNASQPVINTNSDSQIAEPSIPRDTVSSPAPPTSPQKAITTILSAIGENPLHGEHPLTAIHPNVEANSLLSTASIGIEAPTNPLALPVPQTTPVSDEAHGLSSDASISDVSPTLGLPDRCQEKSCDQDDVAMIDMTSDSSPPPVPSWLQPMLPMIRTSSDDKVWQELVDEFIRFENGEPPRGNLPTKHRPKEIADWIKSKKKEVIPSIRSDEFGMRFIAWWAQLQPAWRQIDGKATLPLLREIPASENWQIIKKGGTSGLYIAVVGLSWWVKSQPTNNNLDLWIVVDDLLWVFQQLNRDLVHKGKRAREDDDKENDRPTKSRRLTS